MKKTVLSIMKKPEYYILFPAGGIMITDNMVTCLNYKRV